MKFNRSFLFVTVSLLSATFVACTSDSALDPFWYEGDADNSKMKTGSYVPEDDPSITAGQQIGLDLQDDEGNANMDKDAPGAYGKSDYIDGFGPKIDGVDFKPVYFQYDQNSIVAAEEAKVTEVAQYLLDHPEAGVVIEGYCDERGTDEYNRALGERRAQAALFILLDYGIDQSRIKTNSYGEERPANPGHDESAWSANRRDEFVACYLKQQ